MVFKKVNSFFTYSHEFTFLVVLFYVNDLLVVGNNDTTYDKFKQCLNQCFLIKDIESLRYFIGLELA